MINTQIRQFRDSIIALTNTSPLPIEIKRLVFSEVITAISNEADKTILMEKQENTNESEEKGHEGN